MARQDEFLAALVFKEEVLLRALARWEEVASYMNDRLLPCSPLPIGEFAGHAFGVASVFVEAKVLYPMLDREQANRLWSYTTNLFAVDPERGVGDLRSVRIFSCAWVHAQVRRKDPQEGIARALLLELGYSTEGMPQSVLRWIAGAFVPGTPWWVTFLSKNRLVPSKAPTSLEDFRIYISETPISLTNVTHDGEGSCQVVGGDGGREAGEPAPSPGESSSRKLTRVLVKGVGDGVREEHLWLEEELLAQIANAEGVAHAICTIDTGKPEFHFLPESQWRNFEHIANALSSGWRTKEARLAQVWKLMN